MKNLQIFIFLFVLLSFCATRGLAQSVVASGTVTEVHCHGDSTGSIAYQINGGVGSVRYVWNNGDSGTSVSGCTYIVHITNIGPALDSFQVKVPVTLATGMNANFNNVEFTDTLGNVLPFWLQDFPTATTATFWVRVPSVPIGTTDIYMSFCGTAAITGNPSGTFEFFDDFDNSTLPLWTAAAVSTMAGTTYAVSASNTVYFSPGYSAHLHAGATCTVPPYSGAGSMISRTINPIVNDSFVIDYEDRVATALYDYCSGATGTTNSSLDNNISLGNGQSNSHGGTCATTTSGWAAETSLPFVVTTGRTTIGLEEHGGDCDNSDGWFDDVRIRKYTSHMPTVVIDTSPSLFLNHLGAGTYVITMTNNGSAYTDTFIVTQPPALVPVPDSVNITCGSGPVGSAWVTYPIGGTPGYTFHWSTSGSRDTISNLAAGAYQVTVTDSFSCTASATVNVSQPTNVVSTTADSTNIPCYGQANGKAWANPSGGTPAYTYLWNSGAQTTDTISGLSPGLYTVTVTDAAHCVATASVHITQPAAALTLTTDSINVACYGQATGQASVLASGGTPGYTYVWSNFGLTDTIKNLTANSYTVGVKDAQNCFATATVHITQPLSALSLTTDSINVSCYGQATGQASVLAAGGTTGYTYLWSNAAATDTIKNVTANVYTVTVLDSKNCSATARVNVVQPLAALTLTTDSINVACFGQSTGQASVLAAGGTPGYTYLWSNTGSTDTIKTVAANVYTVTVNDSHNCSATARVNVAQPLAALALTADSINILCYGESTGQASVSAAGGTPAYSYLWSNAATTDTIKSVVANIYTVTVQDAQGCTAAATINVTQPSVPFVVNVTHTDVICKGINNATALATPSGGLSGYTYLWGGGQTADSLSDLSAGTVTVTVTDANHCTVTGSAVIAPSTDSISIDTTAVPATCGLANGSITLTPMGGSGSYQFVWAGNSSTTATISALVGGTYDVTVTDHAGCTSARSVSISQSPAISAVVTTSNDTCDLQKGTASVTITDGTAPYVYIWSPAGTDTAKLDSGTYSLTVTDHNGCTALATFTIENIHNNCQSLVILPTAFTPNGDGVNDTFNILHTPDLEQFQMKIYDRWGQMVFETSDYTQGWDGTYKGKPQPQGVYLVFSEYNFTNKPAQAQEANITLLR